MARAGADKTKITAKPLTDVDGDGKYNSVGETHIWTDEFVDKARAIDVYGSD